jgi:hypothetical protein
VPSSLTAIVYRTVRSEAVAARVADLGLWIEQKRHRTEFRTRQRDALTVVVGDPVRFPRAEKRGARIDHDLIVQREMPRRFGGDDVAHVGRIGWHPAEPAEKHLGAAVLFARDVGSVGTEARVAERRRRNPHAVEHACG